MQININVQCINDRYLCNLALSCAIFAFPSARVNPTIHNAMDLTASTSVYRQKADVTRPLELLYCRYKGLFYAVIVISEQYT